MAVSIHLAARQDPTRTSSISPPCGHRQADKAVLGLEIGVVQTAHFASMLASSGVCDDIA